ncbi:sigma-54-dependent transcriptional regulator [Hymenobacter jeollabukensis]|uniref:Sigma-54-dependent Fis family transcriptional regulator n=1 Tax=Hymenobacter jeollabukensis TaxID=2025313 RepID=A0A5R8WH18_9BACT|nr:sigma-54 dependent transcriptional regulator [Hymenobacter jeollabukensis]TLM87369.1 sigma-54-dependent Fis family transcriptional regulator [Hymenobacter jeollabukensis]
MNLRSASVLVLDDDPDILTAVRLLLKTQVREVTVERRPEALPSLLAARSFDVILLDMNYHSAVNTGNEGFFWLKRIKELGSAAAVIMITAYADIELAVRALKEGAADFVVKPWHNDKLLTTIQDALRPAGAAPAAPAHAAAGVPDLLGSAPALQQIFRTIEKVAPTDANVLILGENGTGKDLVAQAVHRASQRAGGPFVKVDAGALTPSLFESELFGHKKGAFTDAREDRAGRFEAANGGTLFLDEIGNLGLAQQAKLLTVLQNRQVTRLGSNQPIPVDIRLICATNVPLSELADERRFRKDLLYRINTVELLVPPLRQRPADIAALARHFAAQYAAKYHRPAPSLSPAALRKLEQYAWPGNVRELQYTIERAVIMADAPELQPDDLHFSQLEPAPAAQETADNLTLSAVERNAILRVIEKHGGNITRAAQELGLTRTALYRRLNKHAL